LEESNTAYQPTNIESLNAFEKATLRKTKTTHSENAQQAQSTKQGVSLGSPEQLKELAMYVSVETTDLQGI